ncbi:MAG: helix-turn-helix domain-containing protein [Bacteroidales bacterium]|jgi:DNA-binding MarR family transcriptional regulator
MSEDNVRSENYYPFEGYYYTIPAKLIEIAPNRVIPLLYGLIVNLTHKDGYCWASNEFLAKRLKISISTLKRNINWLEEHNLIKRSVNQEMGNLRKIYLSNIPINETLKKTVVKKRVKVTVYGSKNNYTPRFTDEPTPRFTDEPLIIKEENIKEIYKEKNKLGGKDPKPQQKEFLKELSEEERTILNKLYGIKNVCELEREILNFPKTFNKKQKFKSVDVGIRHLATKRGISTLNPPNFNDLDLDESKLKHFKIIESRLKESGFPKTWQIGSRSMSYFDKGGMVIKQYDKIEDIEKFIEFLKNKKTREENFSSPE